MRSPSSRGLQRGQGDFPPALEGRAVVRGAEQCARRGGHPRSVIVRTVPCSTHPLGRAEQRGGPQGVPAPQRHVGHPRQHLGDHRGVPGRQRRREGAVVPGARGGQVALGGGQVAGAVNVTAADLAEAARASASADARGAVEPLPGGGEVSVEAGQVPRRRSPRRPSPPASRAGPRRAARGPARSWHRSLSAPPRCQSTRARCSRNCALVLRRAKLAGEARRPARSGRPRRAARPRHSSSWARPLTAIARPQRSPRFSKVAAAARKSASAWSIRRPWLRLSWPRSTRPRALIHGWGSATASSIRPGSSRMPRLNHDPQRARPAPRRRAS